MLQILLVGARYQTHLVVVVLQTRQWVILWTTALYQDFLAVSYISLVMRQSSGWACDKKKMGAYFPTGVVPPYGGRALCPPLSPVRCVSASPCEELTCWRRAIVSPLQINQRLMQATRRVAL